MKKYIWLIGLFCAGCGQGLTWSSYKDNAAGVALLKTENYTGASERFTDALAVSPFLPELHLNFGLALRGLQKNEEALKSYQNAEKLSTKDSLSLFVSRFNLGESFGKQKKIDEALAWYQKALEVVPDSVEVKTNIELLINQQGQGQGQQDQEQKDQNQQQQGQDQKKDESKDGHGKDQNKDGEGKDKKDQNDGEDKDKDGKKDERKQYQGSGKYKPREFKGDLSESDVKKILGEIRQQEQKIRSEFSRKEAKERPRDKDW